jgi:hypothetical protein
LRSFFKSDSFKGKIRGQTKKSYLSRISGPSLNDPTEYTENTERLFACPEYHLFASRLPRFSPSLLFLFSASSLSPLPRFLAWPFSFLSPLVFVSSLFFSFFSQLPSFSASPFPLTHLFSIIRTGLKRLLDRQDETNSRNNPLILFILLIL